MAWNVLSVVGWPRIRYPYWLALETRSRRAAPVPRKTIGAGNAYECESRTRRYVTGRVGGRRGGRTREEGAAQQRGLNYDSDEK